MYDMRAGPGPDLDRAQGPGTGPSLLKILLGGAVFNVECLSTFRAFVVERKICSPRLDLQSHARLVDPRLFGYCLVLVWSLFGRCWTLFGRCLVVVGRCLDVVGRCLVVVWSLFGR